MELVPKKVLTKWVVGASGPQGPSAPLPRSEILRANPWRLQDPHPDQSAVSGGEEFPYLIKPARHRSGFVAGVAVAPSSEILGRSNEDARGEIAL